MKQNLRYGAVFVVLQATTILSYQIDNLILGHFLGPIAVVELATVWKLCVFPTLLVSAGVAPLWGHSAQLQSRKQTQSAIREALDTMRRISIPLAIFGFGFIILGKQFIIRWTNDLVNPSYFTIIVAVCWVVVYTISQPIAMVLNGIGRFRFILSTAILSTSGNLILSVIFTKALRVPAAPLLGSLVAQIFLYLLPFWLLFVRKSTGRD
jgi:O-antigen/teichoic acid export membrane protein